MHGLLATRNNRTRFAGSRTGPDDQGPAYRYKAPAAHRRERTRADQGDTGTVLGTLSDADGRYVLENVPAGTHVLELLRHAKPTAPI